MKNAGFILFVVGFVMTIYSGFSYVTKEKVVDLGSIEVIEDHEHGANWQPYVGLGIMVIGAGVLYMGNGNKERPG